MLECVSEVGQRDERYRKNLRMRGQVMMRLR